MKSDFGVPVSSVSEQGNKPDLRTVGKAIYEVLTGTGRQGYKQRVRKQPVKIEPEQNYAPAEVAAILNVSYDAALRMMLKMPGLVDLERPRDDTSEAKRSCASAAEIS